ncbi:hypothetical protein M409DRAFT_30158 [Zasmidium cellare ATCC 36951]|uniref:Zn(2)-C6 fungal-type domain-containing protein n=1 Tax=Zasmidium cellare ATCC 36951 TaxID=1080233 RepID=A0A6A6BZH6_ZASCE|nr:uncharacterized protein M409DRAFT_30158 [Zasmidium cellare ATCC 36951]KAF2159408.1 hypothetical protein M409DRAFT_30158 [Zasmidium cellare ATCC 36951]
MSRAKAGERVRRACRNCARARTRCTGGSRCTRCRSKDLTCTYANKSNPLDGKQDVVGTHESHVEPVLQQEIQTAEVIVDPPTSTAAGEPVRSNHPDEAVVNAYDVPSTGLADLAQQSVDDNFSWNDINWLPVADNVDFSLLFGVGLDPAADEGWQSVPVNSQQPAHHAAPASSITSYEDDTAATGKASSLYADGFGGRHSLQTIPRSPVSLDEDNYETSITHLQFPGRVALALHASGFDGPGLDATVYNSLTEHFHSLCTRQAGLGRAFASVTFPSSAQLSRYLGLYLRHFDPDFPFIHATTWSQHTAPWILVLAAATIGSSYDVGPDSFQTEAAFREFLRRAVRWNLDVEIDCDPLPLAQASLLHAIAQFGSNVPASASAARHDFELAMELYETNVVLFPADEIDLSQGALKWQAWIAQEGHTRLMWSCWLVKALYTFWLATPGGHISLPDQLLVLPCDADLWDATNVESWVARFPRTQPSATLLSALQSLFVRHRVPSPIHTFSEVLLTYIILGRADEVARTTQQPLHAWSPGPGDDQSNDEIQLPVSEPIWLPANPRYAAWRNSACDCFDVLHWKANADSTMARGSEGPLILHLHLVRLLLLCPYRSFISLATNLKKRPPTANRDLPSAAQLDESILRWLTMDDHKGRLSLVHAGAVFWHLRRYARGHFYEPFAMYLSSLVIWVYGVYLPQVRGNLLHIKQMNAAERARRLQDNGGIGLSQRNSEEAEDDLTPKTILLDRPCDDEIVQVFVRRGFDMQADMSGAPDISLPNSQKVVLKEAVKVLRRPQHRHVGQSHTYRMALQRLLQFS